MNSFGLCPIKALHWAGLFVILSIVLINYRQGTALFHSLNKSTVISFNKKRLQDIYKIDYTIYAGYGYDRWADGYFGIGVIGKSHIDVGNWGRKGEKEKTPQTLQELLL